MDLKTIKKMSVEDFFKMVKEREINIYDVADIYDTYHKGCNDCIGKSYCNSDVKTSRCYKIILNTLRGGMENQNPRYVLWEDKATWKFVYRSSNKGKIVKVKHRETGKEKYVLLATDNAYIQDIPLPFKVSDYL